MCVYARMYAVHLLLWQNPRHCFGGACGDIKALSAAHSQSTLKACRANMPYSYAGVTTGVLCVG